MTVTADFNTISNVPQVVIKSTVATDDTLAVSVFRRTEYHEAWQSVIDIKLVEWGRDPDQLAEDELIPPTRIAIRKAVDLAQAYRDDNWPPPMRVVPDGDGGIVFERWFGSFSQAIEIDKTGRSELVECRNNKVINRVRII